MADDSKGDDPAHEDALPDIVFPVTLPTPKERIARREAVAAVLGKDCVAANPSIAPRVDDVDENGLWRLEVRLGSNLELADKIFVEEPAPELQQRLTNLREISLFGVYGLSVAGLSAMLTACSASLEKLWLVSLEGLPDEALNIAPDSLQNLKTLDVSVPGAVFSSLLAACGNSLVNVSLTSAKAPSHEAIEAALGPGTQSKLQKLTWGICTSKDALSALLKAHCETLVHLDLRECDKLVLDSVATEAESLLQLRVLSLRKSLNANLSPASVSSLVNAAGGSLDRLDMAFSELSDTFARHLFRACGNKLPPNVELTGNDFVEFPLEQWANNKGFADKIESLNLECRSMRFPPPEFAIDAAPLVRALSKGARELPVVSAILVGDGAAGKTTLARTVLVPLADDVQKNLVKRQQELHADDGICTDATTFAHKFSELATVTGVRVPVLDFPGQMEFYVTHGVLLASVRAVYIVVITLGSDKEMTDAARVEHAMCSLRHWLNMLHDLVGPRAGLQCVVVVTRCDLMVRDPSVWKIEVRQKVINTVTDVERYDGAFVMCGEPIFVNYREARADLGEETPCNTDVLREVVLERAVLESRRVAVPGSFVGAFETVHARAEQLVSGDELARLIGNDEFASLNDRLLCSMGMVLRHNDVAVLRPMEWFARLLAYFVWDTDRTRNELRNHLPRAGVDKWSTLHFHQREDQAGEFDLPGYVGVTALLKSGVLGPGKDETDTVRVLELLAAQGLCTLVRSVEDATPLPRCRVTYAQLSEHIGSETGDVRGAVFPTLLARPPDEPLDAFARAWPPIESEVVVSRRFECKDDSRRLPAGLFPALQTAVMARLPGKRVRVDIARDQLVVRTSEAWVWLRQPSNTPRIEVYGRGESAYKMAVNFVVEELLVYELLPSYRGASFALFACCPHCLDVPGDHREAYAPCGTRLEIRLPQDLYNTPWRWRHEHAFKDLPLVDDTIIADGIECHPASHGPAARVFPGDALFGCVPMARDSEAAGLQRALFELLANTQYTVPRLVIVLCTHEGKKHDHYRAYYLCECNNRGRPHLIADHPGYFFKLQKDESRKKRARFAKAASFMLKFLSVSVATGVSVVSAGLLAAPAAWAAGAAVAATGWIDNNTDGDARDWLASAMPAMKFGGAEASARINVSGMFAELAEQQVDAAVAANAGLERDGQAAKAATVQYGELSPDEAKLIADAVERNPFSKKHEERNTRRNEGNAPLGLLQLVQVGARPRWVCAKHASARDKLKRAAVALDSA